MTQRSLEGQIRAAYKQYPQADSRTILEVVGCKDTLRFRETLIMVQQQLRGFRPSHRKNHHAYPLRASG